MSELATIADRFVKDPDVRATYARDESLGVEPPEHFEVVRARDVADVVEVLTYAAGDGHPGRAAGGAAAGSPEAAWRIEGGIVLSLEGLDRSRGRRPAGGGRRRRDRESSPPTSRRPRRRAGLFYPPDPASSAFCTVGGNIATNAGGLCCVKYGVTADYVRSLQVVLAGGEVIQTGRRTAKGVAGLDLTGLFVGSRGHAGRRHPGGRSSSCPRRTPP